MQRTSHTSRGNVGTNGTALALIFMVLYLTSRQRHPSQRYGNGQSGKQHWRHRAQAEVCWIFPSDSAAQTRVVIQQDLHVNLFAIRFGNGRWSRWYRGPDGTEDPICPVPSISPSSRVK